MAVDWGQTSAAMQSALGPLGAILAVCLIIGFAVALTRVATGRRDSDDD